MKKLIYTVPLFLLCIVTIYIIYPTDEKRIRGIIKKSEKAIITENINKLMESISYNYSDEYGNGYLQIKKKMQIAFERLESIDVERNIIKISVKEDNAEADLSVRVISSIGDERGYIIGDAGKEETIKVFFEKTSYKWLITKVEGVNSVRKDGVF